MVSKQGRQEASIDPAEGPLAVFAIGLRDLRRECGDPTYRTLATWSAKASRGRGSGSGSAYSDTTFSTAARGHTRPSLPVALAYVRACLTYAKVDEERIAREVAEWTARWEALDDGTSPVEPPEPDPTAPEPPPESPSPESPPADDPPAKDAASAPRRTRARRGVLAVLGAAAVLVGVVFGVRYVSAPGASAARSTAADGPVRTAPPPALGVPNDAARMPSTGGNSRCARVRYAGGIAWSPCTRVDAATLDFAVWLSNPGREPVTVAVKLSYVQAGAVRACPGEWGVGVRIEIAPGTSTTPDAACAVDKLPALASQTKAWVVLPGEASWGYREMSPTVHVQADGRTALWADEA
ncbi:hypothetical protein [Streptomyces sp. NPDC094032]|uniref:hypothetical protein n=1 Tax=Streptomyces sp. NPDC094032 TaxID=3155308 RepID=UPI0033238009